MNFQIFPSISMENLSGILREIVLNLQITLSSNGLVKLFY